MRVLLFLGTNLAVILVASMTFRLLGLEGILMNQGVDLNLTGLLIFCGVFGMAGAFISLLLSKWMAKRSTGAQVIEQPRSQTESWLVDTVRRQAAEALGHPWHAAQVPRLSAVARRDEPRVARAATRSLDAIGSPAARAALRDVAATRDDDVARTARRLLGRKVGAKGTEGESL